MRRAAAEGDSSSRYGTNEQKGDGMKKRRVERYKPGGKIKHTTQKEALKTERHPAGVKGTR